MTFQSNAKNFFFAVLILLCALGMQPSFATKIKVVVRYDDFSRYGDAERRLQLERSLFDAVAGMKGTTLVGVIPYPDVSYPVSLEATLMLPPLLSEERAGLLREHATSGTVLVGLHGFNHRPNKSATVRSEFVGLSESQQTFLISTAKRALESVTGVNVKVFIPPFNTYDEATLKALATAGFDLVSANLEQPVAVNLPGKYLPGGVYPGNLKRAVLNSLANGFDDALIVTTIHPYDFTESGESFSKFRKDNQIELGAFLRDLRGLYDAGLISLASTADFEKSGEDFSAARYMSNQRLRQSWVSEYDLLPHFFGLNRPNELYYARAVADRIRLQQLAAGIGIYGAIALLFVFIAYRFIPFSTTRRKLTPAVGVAFVVTVCMAIATKLVFGNSFHAIAVCIATLAGLTVGAGAQRFARRRYGH